MVSQCSTDLVKLVTVEQSCRVLTSAIFRDCNSVVSKEISLCSPDDAVAHRVRMNDLKYMKMMRVCLVSHATVHFVF